MTNKTTIATVADNQKAMDTWHVVDASKYILGRMAVAIAERLMGKHSPLYTPHLSVGEGVIVINADKVQVTGQKRERRTYRRYTGYIGGLREETMKVYLEKRPEEMIKLAVKRMLPKTRFGRNMLKRLKVYNGSTHPHVAQKPNELELNV